VKRSHLKKNQKFLKIFRKELGGKKVALQLAQWSFSHSFKIDAHWFLGLVPMHIRGLIK